MIEQIGKWIYALKLEQPADLKTSRWSVRTNDGEQEIGQVKWYGAWRCYAYFPNVDTLYEKDCLRSISNFCDAQTVKQRGTRKGEEGEP